jgi:hypothetical protein
MPLSAIAINCTLKHSDGPASSTDRMIALLTIELEQRGVARSETIRIADHDIKPWVAG